MSEHLRFVVHQHQSRRPHYDFRLEAAGALASWAVPKGPSLDPAARRLAIHVEDHPFAYRTFEGVIPEGEYGAGAVTIWDHGTYRLAEGSNPASEIRHGKIVFELHGKKLRGLFTLVKMHGARYGGDAWLLIKDRDEFAKPSSSGKRSSRLVAG
jgi:bifunctional non-homologous end joining protein LigD